MAKNQQQHQGGNKQQGGGKPYNALEPMSPKQLRHQAAATMRAVYKPAFKQLGREQKRLVSISEKRKSDNAYYLNWLNTQAQQLQAHEDAANAALTQAGHEAQSEVTKGYEDLHSQLQQSGQEMPGVVSNAGQANAYDVSGAASTAAQQVGAERARSQAQIATTTGSGALASANNFAMIAAAEANRQADLWKNLSKLGDAKQSLRLNKAADTAKEVARLLDREVEKAKTRADIHANAVNAALAAGKFNLDKQKFGLDVSEFEYNKHKYNRKYRLEAAKAQETKSYHEAEVGLSKAKSHQEKAKESHKITHVIQEGISYIASHKKLNQSIAKNPESVIQRLTKILGSSVAAHAAVELFTHGKLNPTTRGSLEQIGYIVPPKWR